MNHWQQVTMRSYRNCSNCCPCSVLPTVVNNNWTQVKKNHRYLVYYLGEATVRTPSIFRFYLLIFVKHRGWQSTLLTCNMYVSHCLSENHPWSLIINIRLRLPLLSVPYCTRFLSSVCIKIFILTCQSFSKLTIWIIFIFCFNLTITMKSFSFILFLFMA